MKINEVRPKVMISGTMKLPNTTLSTRFIIKKMHTKIGKFRRTKGKEYERPSDTIFTGMCVNFQSGFNICYFS